MIAGRLHWKKAVPGLTARTSLAAFDFADGTLLLTEAGPKKRASLDLGRGEEAVAEHGRGGLEVLDADLGAFRAALTRENHTLKRALTDPRLFSGIGNAYSDEILHRARLSPAKLTSRLTEPEIGALYDAVRTALAEWTDRLTAQARKAFPEKVTAFREGMAVHGRFGKPCPVCGTKVQRIVYAENESNYCPTCQTGGKLLADRALSQLLKGDWPKTLEELELRKKPVGLCPAEPEPLDPRPGATRLALPSRRPSERSDLHPRQPRKGSRKALRPCRARLGMASARSRSAKDPTCTAKRPKAHESWTTPDDTTLNRTGPTPGPGSISRSAARERSMTRPR